MAKTTATARQTSRKAGVTSTAKKMDSTPHGFAQEPPARKVTGAFGQEARGSARKPGTATSRKGMASALDRMKGRRREG
jgi:hypothetical protein